MVGDMLTAELKAMKDEAAVGVEVEVVLPQAQVVLDAESEAELWVAAEATKALETVTEARLEMSAHVESEVKVEAEAEAGMEAEVDVWAETEIEVEAKADVEAEVQGGGDADAEVKTEPGFEAEAAAEAEVVADAEAEAEAAEVEEETEAEAGTVAMAVEAAAVLEVAATTTAKVVAEGGLDLVGSEVETSRNMVEVEMMAEMARVAEMQDLGCQHMDRVLAEGVSMTDIQITEADVAVTVLDAGDSALAMEPEVHAARACDLLCCSCCRGQHGFQKLAVDEQQIYQRHGVLSCMGAGLLLIASVLFIANGLVLTHIFYDNDLNYDDDLNFVMQWIPTLTSMPPPHAPPRSLPLPDVPPPPPTWPPRSPPFYPPQSLPSPLPPSAPPSPLPPCDAVLAGMTNLCTLSPPGWCKDHSNQKAFCEESYVVTEEAAWQCEHNAATGVCAEASKPFCNLADSFLPTGGACDSTIAYAFLTRSSLPLWSTWESFFSGCAPGSSVPIIHSQNASSASRLDLQQKAARQNGVLLDLAETVFDDLRFSWKMVAATLHLYGAASTMLAPNGCRPRFVHLVSERDAPIADCAAVQAELTTTPRSSRVQWVEERVTSVQKRIPPEYRPIAETSQWMTLWMEHAAALAADEDVMQAKWWPHWNADGHILDLGFRSAPDEVVLASELVNRGFHVSTGGMTKVAWCTWEQTQLYGCARVDNFDESSPSAYTTYESALAFCKRSRHEGFFFARKFGDGSSASSSQVGAALASRDCLDSTFAGGRSIGE